MSPTIIAVLTSAVVSSAVVSLFTLIAQIADRRARRKQMIFDKALELAKANRDFLVMYAEKTKSGVKIADFVVYAEVYHSLLTELHDKGKLPDGWLQKTSEKMDAVFGKGERDYMLG